MTRKNNAQKREARAYMAANPDVNFHEAMRIVKRPSLSSAPPVLPDADPVMTAISVALPGLAGKELANTFDDMAGMGSWSLKLDPDFDGPARISWVEIDSSTVDFEVHEVLDDGGRIGEARVDVVITYEAFMHKADYAAARDDVDWWLDDDDWNDHYVTIRGEIKGTLTAHVAINGEEIEIEFQDVEGR